MPRHCSAGGCKSRDNRETRNAGITFHRLPKGATRRNIWIANSHRADSWDPQTDFVYFCSKHFTPESFELTGCSGIRRLKDDAFPTVFNSSSTTKCIRARSVQKQEDIHVRSCSGSKELTPYETDQGPSSEEHIVQRSVATSGETHENNPASPREPSWGEHISRQEHEPSPPPQSRPISPSCYMRRLPPPPGFYLSKEHSYAQLCPLLWKRRYDQAVDCLEKALRQLHAARRRENRLRSTVHRLRDKQLKHTLMVSHNGCKNRGTAGGERRLGKEGPNQKECETDAKSEDTGLFEERCVDLSGNFLPGPNSWSEEEKGYCFYCERGQVHVGVQVAHRLSKSTEHEDSDRIHKSVETSKCGTAENTKDIKIVRLERPFEKKVQTNDPDIAHYSVVVQNPSLPSVSLPVTDEQSLELLSSQQKPLVSHSCEVESEAVDMQQQQLLWIQDSAEKQVILLPVPGVDGLQSFLMTEGVTDEAQTILVSEMDLKRCLGHTTDIRGLTRAETTCDHSDQHSVINSAAVERREDVRDKLKEHLEGFHLQLSSEFIN
ncbi:THAP domain-containing protein 7 isoform X3 [Scophthalmus maximus]|uniref:THAP-type domain-containing protein n=2 Tax=Scophthalmus maximus TaxID=52904 RepID=A0A6A4TNG4_SCOMX|nr:THAP domain-containing protein 7 isoform X3 [Scophthalmus maximus]XP_035489217.1 THAP domain-containing protein 7 isoform X3 [Scophthalmus maximus]XP_035489218.1 THAP domain-containing protein 7 isoform X3 [Scophthalmus maximus]XP_035489219.1 THAP domain-containing protein 7 isoform X3 [Scophthalmus maximus]XP_035489220.1 THAP domain-containing protein 7 isoform X3 [Scophthalmus maximus]XP_035489222.1 THAP domain-containing protein 7 isoform X3 [Scophthalmus maximus]XP_035489223.1 THAP dom